MLLMPKLIRKSLQLVQLLDQSSPLLIVFMCACFGYTQRQK